MNIFHEKLKNLRTAKNISQYELAKIMQYSQSLIGAWETGKREPSIDALIELSRFFGVSVDYLVGNSESMATSTNPNLFEVFPYEKPVIKAYRVLPPSGQEMVCRMLGISYDAVMPVAKEA